MQFRRTILVVSLFTALLLFQQCSKKDTTAATTTTTGTVVTSPNLPATAFNYIAVVPAYIQPVLNQNDNTPADNAITNDGATLGRVLFYDKNLSQNKTISCASCHKQEYSFSDTGALSKGFAGTFTARHSMAVLNLRFYKSGKMFWDERASSVEKQALVPIQSSVEMGLTLSELETRVKALSYYPPLFQKAFGSTAIDSVKIAKAIAQFERAIVSYNSKYDQVKQGFAAFTPDEAAGEQLFLTPPAGTAPGGGPLPSCATCHTPPMFMNSAAPPFGLADANDHGINNENRFKDGTLRNIFGRGKLFHNGSVTSLQAMLAGGPPGAPTNVPAHSVAPQDVPKLLAFMQTLTDNTITADIKFSDPFK
ncbi:MAG: cytochrome-c peroxidase [Bacteroidetes bacterium]|nr:cytochrome-c peroxidase [Bacteroidota bacterium]